MGRKTSLSPFELGFSLSYIKNGNNAYQAAVENGWSPKSSQKNSYSILKRPIVKEFIAQKIESVKKEMEADFDWCVAKLKKGVELSIPDDAVTKEGADVRAGVNCISELNKMFGHYAAEKRETKVGISEEDILKLNEVKDLVHKLIEENKKEF